MRCGAAIRMSPNFFCNFGRMARWNHGIGGGLRKIHRDVKAGNILLTNEWLGMEGEGMATGEPTLVLLVGPGKDRNGKLFLFE